MNHQNFERILRFRDIPGSMLVGVSAHPPSPHPILFIKFLGCAVVYGRQLCAFFILCERVVPRRGDLQFKYLTTKVATRFSNSKPRSIQSCFAGVVLGIYVSFKPNHQHQAYKCFLVEKRGGSITANGFGVNKTTAKTGLNRSKVAVKQQPHLNLDLQSSKRTRRI